jgi:AraC-like DNA-binding protein
MIREINGMIAGCIDRMSKDGCGGCVRRDPCTALFSRFFAPRREAEGAPPQRAAPAQRVPRVLAFLGEMAAAVERRAQPAPGGPVRRRVEAAIEPLLKDGRARIGEVAFGLGMSRQTLYRRLAEEGVTFEEVLDALRRRLAMRMMRQEKMSVKEAAWRLGFAEPAAFSRAFKRWTGKSPSEVRDRS